MLSKKEKIKRNENDKIKNLRILLNYEPKDIRNIMI